MPGVILPCPALPTTMRSMPSQNFDALIAANAQRVSWARSHTCPCVYAGGGAAGRLPQLGSPQRSCTKCSGVGVYWDAPGPPMPMYLEFIHRAPTSDEPGTRFNEEYGTFQSTEPSITIPYANPNFAVGDPNQPTQCWTYASVDDRFVPVDMQTRYTAVLQVGIKQNLPFQQNLAIAPSGAVTVWDPSSGNVDLVSGYTVSGATVAITGYPPGTNYMVEFLAAPVYVAFRVAGGLPHIRPLGGGTVNEPRRFRLQALDFWTRQRGLEPQAAGSAQMTGTLATAPTLIGSI